MAGAATQRKRLLLLAYLADPPPRRFARGSLVGLFWPEQPEESARHLLSVTIHALRGALEPGALCADPLEVWLDPDPEPGAGRTGR